MSDDSTKQQYWQANNALESLRLSSSHNGWNLAGISTPPQSRTRNGGNGRPNLAQPPRALLYDSDESSYSYETDSDSDLSEHVTVDTVEKPPTSRVLLEVTSLRKAFEANCVCPLCQSKVDFTIDYHGDDPAKANIQVRNFPFDNRERNTDYAINIIYVLGLISVGDGCVEAARLCGLLSLPRDTSMEKRSFPIIEERIGPEPLSVCIFSTWLVVSLHSANV